MTFPPFLLAGLRIARVASSEELGTMSKNNLRRITLVRGPIWGIHSLTLIISCFRLKQCKSLTPQREGEGSIGTVIFGPQPPPHSPASFLTKQYGNSHSLFADFPRGISRRLGRFCEFCALSSLSSVHYDEQRDLGREPRGKRVLVFSTRAANVAIPIETSSSFFRCGAML